MNRLGLGLPVVLYCTVIFWFSSLPELPYTASAFPDKLAHLVVYTGLGWLVSRWPAADPSSSETKIWATALVFCLLYGITDEFHQHFVPGRSVEVLDAGADAIGGFVGGLAYTRGRHLARKSRNGQHSNNRE